MDGQKIVSGRLLKRGTILDKKYEIINVISESSNSITYKAVNQNIKMTVVIKEYMPSALSTRNSLDNDNSVCLLADEYKNVYKKGMQSFLDEAKNIAKFQRIDAIVKIKDYFKANNTAYIVMEFVKGLSLEVYLRTIGGRLELDKTLDIMLPVVNALAQMNVSKLIHRNVNPENILIRADGSPVLIGFNAARYVEDEKSISIFINPGFTPIEQYERHGVQGSFTDVYSICATIYYCLSGTMPQNPAERYGNKDKMPKLINKLEIPEELKGILIDGLAVKGSDRIASTGDLLAELSHFARRKYKLKKSKGVKAFLVISAVAASLLSCVIALGIKESKIREMLAIESEQKVEELNEKNDTLDQEIESVVLEVEAKQDEINNVQQNIETIETKIKDEEENKKISKTEEELKDILTKTSGEYIWETVYSDFDGDGVNEMFASTNSKYDVIANVLDWSCIEMVDDDSRTDYSLWFVNGEECELIKHYEAPDYFFGMYYCGLQEVYFGKTKVVAISGYPCMAYHDSNSPTNEFFSYKDSEVSEFGILEGGNVVIKDSRVYLNCVSGYLGAPITGTQCYLNYPIAYLNDDFYELKSVPIDKSYLNELNNWNLDFQLEFIKLDIFAFDEYVFGDSWMPDDAVYGEPYIDEVFYNDAGKIYINVYIPWESERFKESGEGNSICSTLELTLSGKNVIQTDYFAGTRMEKSNSIGKFVESDVDNIWEN